MRNYSQEYKILFCDIDDTLIYGFWTDIMHHTWEWFKNDTLSNILMYLQAKFKLYSVNKKLLYILKQHPFVVFITARAPHEGTEIMLQDIMGKDNHSYILESLNAPRPYIDKISRIKSYCKLYRTDRVCLWDDNSMTRLNCAQEGIDAFDPEPMIRGIVW